MEETRQAHAAGLDLDHAVAMVRERTKDRYVAFSPEADPAIAEKFERVSGAVGNVEGIMHWLGKTLGPRRSAGRCPLSSRLLAQPGSCSSSRSCSSARSSNSMPSSSSRRSAASVSPSVSASAARANQSRASSARPAASNASA